MLTACGPSSPHEINRRSLAVGLKLVRSGEGAALRSPLGQLPIADQPGNVAADVAAVAVFGEDVRRERMKAPVVVECTVDTELAELIVLDAADLHADLSTGGAHEPHAPRQAALRIGCAQRQQTRPSWGGDADAGVRAQRSLLFHRATTQHACGSHRDRAARQREHHRHHDRVRATRQPRTHASRSDDGWPLAAARRRSARRAAPGGFVDARTGRCVRHGRCSSGDRVGSGRLLHRWRRAAPAARD